MLPPELVQAHFEDLTRAFRLLILNPVSMTIGHLPEPLRERLLTNGYVVVSDNGMVYEWSDDIYAFYTLYAAWQEKLTAFISTMEGDKE